jgi:hypothetical protein
MMKGYDVVKKILSLVLVLLLLISTGIIAAAAPESPDSALNERLKAITLSVKETLDIGDEFTSFNGSLDEYGTVSRWSLSWSKDDEQLYVSANENGRIVSYNHYYSDNSVPVQRGNIPRFPKIDLEEAKAIAAAFLGKVLDKEIETIELRGSSNLDYSGNAVYYLNGIMKLFGVETPVSISLSVSSSTKKVTSFYRSDSGQAYGGVSKPSAASDKAAAAEALKSTLNMKLIYALPGDGAHTARLQYQPNPDGSYVVDALTGKLLDLSKLDWSDSRPGMNSKDEAAASAAPESGGLTTVEQAVIDQLQGVLSQSELEKNIRAYPELGLTADFELRYVNYYTYEDEDKETQVTAALEFTDRPEDESAPFQYRYVTMDARTGRLISLSSNRPYYDTAAQAAPTKYTGEQTEAIARTFAGKILPDELKQTALSQESAVGSTADSARYYAFLRTHDTIFFPENYINVGVDAETGYVISFYSNWYQFDVTFVSAAGKISAETAASTYSVAVGTALRYVSVPASTNESGLLLAYTAADTSVWGVDAISGELLKTTYTEDPGITYDDLAGNPYAAQINRLASFGVGYCGGSFKPNAQLTQLDALILIVSTSGRKVMPFPVAVSEQVGAADEKAPQQVSSGETDDIYDTAYSMGILTPEEKDPTKLISRAEYAKYLVNALGYGEVARLPGIFKAGFGDDKDIPSALMGYVAIARGLKIVNGDENGNFKPNDIASRTMAAIMLYNCMNRK